MSVTFFRIPVFDPAAAEAALNQFTASHRVAHIEKHFAQHGTSSCWAVCVAWLACSWHGTGTAGLPAMAARWVLCFSA